jgi:hypothetical protein
MNSQNLGEEFDLKAASFQAGAGSADQHWPSWFLRALHRSGHLSVLMDCSTVTSAVYEWL